MGESEQFLEGSFINKWVLIDFTDERWKRTEFFALVIEKHGWNKNKEGRGIREEVLLHTKNNNNEDWRRELSLTLIVMQKLINDSHE